MDRELIKGSATLLALEVLAERAMHGYQLMRELEARSEGLFAFKEGTIYPLLRSLEREGALAAAWSTAGGRRRRVYALTDAGRRLLDRKRAEWRAFREAMEHVVAAPDAEVPA